MVAYNIHLLANILTQILLLRKCYIENLPLILLNSLELLALRKLLIFVRYHQTFRSYSAVLHSSHQHPIHHSQFHHHSTSYSLDVMGV